MICEGVNLLPSKLSQCTASLIRKPRHVRFAEIELSHRPLYATHYSLNAQLINLLLKSRSQIWNSIGPKFKVREVHAIQINHQPDATIFQFIILTFIYGSTCFGRFPAHHQELNDCSGSLTQHDYHHDRKVKPEAATAVELLIVGGERPKHVEP